MTKFAALLMIWTVVISLAVTVTGYTVKFLWNALVPEVCPHLGLAHQITFWQAVGLSLLTTLLFRNWPVTLNRYSD